MVASESDTGVCRPRRRRKDQERPSQLAPSCRSRAYSPDMRRQQLEAIVLTAVERLRAGGAIEDDLIECKRVWPDPVKVARQLAGACNRANGEPVIYVVGLDEKTGLAPMHQSVDTADWWAKVASRFHQAEPTLDHHVHLDLEAGGAVTVLLFGTDRAPYLVKTLGGGSPELEVPIRDGTRTRSATRSELLRLLAATSSVPPSELLYAKASGHFQGPSRQGHPGYISLTGAVGLFFEYVGKDAIFLPPHRFRASLHSAEFDQRLSLTLAPGKSGNGFVTASGGSESERGIIITGPGQCTLTLRASPAMNMRGRYERLEEWTLRLEMGVAASTRPLMLQARMGLARNRVPLPPTTETFSKFPTWESISTS